MSHSPTNRLLCRAQARATLARRIGVPLDELDGHLAEPSRRRFVAGALGLGALAAMPAIGCSGSSDTDSSEAASSLRVLVVGGGLAGLTAAYRLAQAGADVTLHEASGHVGGRTRTLRGFFGDDRSAENGGEFINSDQGDIRSLCRELDLELEDLWEGYPDNAGSVWSFDGNPYLRTEAIGEWAEVAPAIARDFAAAGTDVRWDNHTEAAKDLDHTSLAEWVDVNVPGGRSSRLGKLIEVVQIGEWGGTPEAMSALNLVLPVGASSGQMDLVGGSDERWHVEGGNDQIAGELAARIGGGAVELGSALVAVRRIGPGVRCTFESGGATNDVDADRVVLALPFSTLRFVDLDGAELSDHKQRVIEEIRMGTNAKLQLEFSERAWRDEGANGDSASDTPLMVTWEGIITEPGPTGVLVAYSGGAVGASYGFPSAHGEAPAELVGSMDPHLETLFGPGTPAASTGRAWLDSWVDDPFTRGSYTYWGLGHYTELRGAAGTAEGPIHFCGEHTSLDHVGFMNGAVETGERAAAEILAG